jgi:hypothetical protein
MDRNRNRNRACLDCPLKNPVTLPLSDSNESILFKQLAYFLPGKLSALGHIRLQIE